jgi:hypothetical protein
MLQFLVVEGLDRYASCCFFRASCYKGIMDRIFVHQTSWSPNGGRDFAGRVPSTCIFLQQYRLSYQKKPNEFLVGNNKNRVLYIFLDETANKPHS